MDGGVVLKITLSSNKYINIHVYMYNINLTLVMEALHFECGDGELIGAAVISRNDDTVAVAKDPPVIDECKPKVKAPNDGVTVLDDDAAATDDDDACDDDDGWGNDDDDDDRVIGNLSSSALSPVASGEADDAVVDPNVNGDGWVVPIAPQ